MADKLINQLTQIDTIANDDSIPIYDASAEETKKVLWSQMKTGALSQNNPLPITSGAVWDATQKVESGSGIPHSGFTNQCYFVKIGHVCLLSINITNNTGSVQKPYMTLLSGLPESFSTFIITVSNSAVLFDITGTELHLTGATSLQIGETIYGHACYVCK